MQTLSREAILQEALSWENVRWRHQGRSRNGIDCVGLVVLTAKGCGLDLYDTTEYPRTTRFDSLVRVFRQHLREKLLRDRLPGDILLFRDGIDSCHSAILSTLYGQEAIIHAYAKRRKVVHELLTQDLKKTMTYCFEFPGVN